MKENTVFSSSHKVLQYERFFAKMIVKLEQLLGYVELYWGCIQEDYVQNSDSIRSYTYQNVFICTAWYITVLVCKLLLFVLWTHCLEENVNDKIEPIRPTAELLVRDAVALS